MGRLPHDRANPASTPQPGHTNEALAISDLVARSGSGTMSRLGNKRGWRSPWQPPPCPELSILLQAGHRHGFTLGTLNKSGWQPRESLGNCRLFQAANRHSSRKAISLRFCERLPRRWQIVHSTRLPMGQTRMTFRKSPVGPADRESPTRASSSRMTCEERQPGVGRRGAGGKTGFPAVVFCCFQRQLMFT